MYIMETSFFHLAIAYICVCITQIYIYVYHGNLIISLSSCMYMCVCITQISLTNRYIILRYKLHMMEISLLHFFQSSAPEHVLKTQNLWKFSSIRKWKFHICLYISWTPYLFRISKSLILLTLSIKSWVSKHIYRFIYKEHLINDWQDLEQWM